MSNALALRIMSPRRFAPSRREYSEWVWRWTKDKGPDGYPFVQRKESMIVSSWIMYWYLSRPGAYSHASMR